MSEAAPPSAGAIRIEGTTAEPRVTIRTAQGRWVALHSTRDPIREAAAWLSRDAGDGDPPAVVVVLGAGAGYVLDEIELRFPAAAVVVLEPERELAALCRQRRRGRDAADDRIQWLTGPDYGGAADLWRTFDLHPGRVIVLEHPVIAREWPAQTAAAREVLRRARFDLAANADARRRFAGPYLLNTLTNLPHILSSGDVTALQGVGRGHAAVVVGAGPSLDDVIADLRRLRERAIVVAVDTALRPLLAAGIHPDFVVAVDPSETNARHLRDFESPPQSWLVAEPSLHPSAFPSFEGRVFTFKVSAHHPWPWLNQMGIDRGTLRAWGSVLTSAFDFALLIGCDPVVFIGADLAYTDGRPYCRGTTFERDWADQVAAGVALDEQWRGATNPPGGPEAPDLHGRMVASAGHLVAVRDWLLEDVSRGDRRVINAGGGILTGKRLVGATLDAAIGPSPPLAPELTERILAAHSAGAAALPQQQAALRALAARPHEIEHVIAPWCDALAGMTTTAIQQRLIATLENLPRSFARPAAPARSLDDVPAEGPSLWPPEREAVLNALRAGEACPEGLRLPDDPAAAAQALAFAADAFLASTHVRRDARDWLAHAARLVGDPPAPPPTVGLPPQDAAVTDLEWLHAAPETIAVETPRQMDTRRLWTVLLLRLADRESPTLFARMLRAVAMSDLSRSDVPRHDRPVRATVRVRGTSRIAVLEDAAVDDAHLAEAFVGALADVTRGAAGADFHVSTAAIAGLPEVEVHLEPNPANPAFADAAWTLSPTTRRLVFRDLSVEGLGRSYIVTQDAGAALVVRGDGTTVTVDAGGRTSGRDPWPEAVGTELPWGDGAIAWNLRSLFARSAPGAEVERHRMPGLAYMAAVDDDGSVLFPTSNAGLWRWSSGTGFRLMAATPPVLGIHKIGEGFDLVPIAAVVPPFPRVKLRYAWHWSPGRDRVVRVEGDAAGQSWSRATAHGIEAIAYPFSDFVRLRLSDWDELRLTVPQPVTVAWAGTSLIVTTGGGHVLLFEDLLHEIGSLRTAPSVV